jgi:hypothetical protein
MKIDKNEENDLFNGFKCTRNDKPVVDMNRTELVTFIGLLDELVTRKDNTITVLRSDKNRLSRWINDAVTRPNTEGSGFYQEELPPEIKKLMGAELG